MTSEISVALLVLSAAAMHATWNAVIKAGSDRLLTQTWVMTVGLAISLAVVPFVPIPDRASWPFLGLSIVAHSGYYGFLVLAYRHGDLSHVYPVARGMAPLTVSLMAAVLVGETLTPRELAGVVLVTVGIASLALVGGGSRTLTRGPLLYALGTGLFISSYTLIDGMGVRRAGTDLGFIAWLFMLDALPFILLVVLLQRRRLVGFLRSEWKPGLLGGVLATLGYSIVLWAMNRSDMAHVVSLRETSVILAALIGTFVLKETSGMQRMPAVLAVAAGNILLYL